MVPAGGILCDVFLRADSDLWHHLSFEERIYVSSGALIYPTPLSLWEASVVKDLGSSIELSVRHRDTEAEVEQLRCQSDCLVAVEVGEGIVVVVKQARQMPYQSRGHVVPTARKIQTDTLPEFGLTCNQLGRKVTQHRCSQSNSGNGGTPWIR